jgi:hypothetical protein
MMKTGLEIFTANNVRTCTAVIKKDSFQLNFYKNRIIIHFSSYIPTERHTIPYQLSRSIKSVTRLRLTSVSGIKQRKNVQHPSWYLLHTQLFRTLPVLSWIQSQHKSHANQSIISNGKIENVGWN